MLEYFHRVFLLNVINKNKKNEKYTISFIFRILKLQARSLSTVSLKRVSDLEYKGVKQLFDSVFHIEYNLRKPHKSLFFHNFNVFLVFT